MLAKTFQLEEVTITTRRNKNFVLENKTSERWRKKATRSVNIYCFIGVSCHFPTKYYETIIWREEQCWTLYMLANHRQLFIQFSEKKKITWTIFKQETVRSVQTLCANHAETNSVLQIWHFALMASTSTDSLSNKLLSKTQIKTVLCAECPVSLDSECDENTPGGAQDPRLYDTSQHLGFHTYHVETSELTAVPRNAVYWEQNPGPRAQGIKPRLFLSAPAATAPRFHFPSAPIAPVVSAAAPFPFHLLAPCQGEGPGSHSPGDGGSFSVFSGNCWEEKAISLFHPPVIPLPFQCRAHLSPPGSIPLCPAAGLLPREADLGGFVCLSLEPAVSRGRGWAGMRVMDTKDTIAGELTCSWTHFSPHLKTLPLHL